MRYNSDCFSVLKLVATSAFIMFSCITFAQSHSDRIRPQWLKKVPEASNGTYNFENFHIQAENMSEAKRKLPDEAAFYLQRSYSVSGMTVETTEISDEYRNGENAGHMKTTMRDTVFTETHKTTVTIRVVDEYIDRNEYHFLCAIPNINCTSVIYDRTVRTTKYGGLGLWRSAIVPGWGQMYKGSWFKGGLILGGSVALAGGALTCGLMRNDNLAKIETTHSTSVKQQYRTRINGLNTGMYCCIGGLAALYVYNLVDAVVASGARRIIVYPATYADGSVGLGAAVRF